MIVIPDVGKIFWLKRALYSSAAAEDLTLKLYSNNYTPIDASDVGDFTEASFTGYTSRTLTSSQSGSTWAEPLTTGGVGYSTYQTTQTWTATSDETIYGWYLVGATSGTLAMAEKFPGSGFPLIGASSTQLIFTPKIQDNDI